jgi:hypothetical protein
LINNNIYKFKISFFTVNKLGGLYGSEHSADAVITFEKKDFRMGELCELKMGAEGVDEVAGGAK